MTNPIAASMFPELGDGGRGVAQHERATASKTSLTWLTPPPILAALGPFDLDPCAAPEPRPWSTAAVHWTKNDGSLNRPWKGRVWLNPPYGHGEIEPWLRRMAEHNHGTALLFTRVETEIFFECVWDRAIALLFLRGRISFHRRDGAVAINNAGAGSVLVAYGEADANVLAAALAIHRLDGKLIWLRR